ncbi:MAG: glycosyltransferase family 4 protein [Bdellovibrionota bacterium]
MKIISIYYTEKPGGFCKRLFELLNGLTDHEHEVHFLALDKPSSKLSEKVKFHRIPFPLETREGLLFWLIFTSWAPLYTTFKALIIQPSRFVVFGSYYSTIVSPAKYFVGQKIVLFIRSLVFDVEKGNQVNFFIRLLSKLIYRFGTKNADQLIFQTLTMKTRVESFTNGSFVSFELLPNNVVEIPESKEHLELNIPKDRFVILTAGMFNQAKNIEYLIKAVAELDEEIFLLIAGDGPALPRLKSLCKKLNLESVYFTGWLPSLFPAMKAAKLLVHPSIREGMSNTILEALGFELPVLASNIPEHHEILTHKELLFSLTDEGKELKSLLREAINNPDSYKNMKYLSKERAFEYSFNWCKRAVELATK